jgi:hypothetical protein
VIADRYSTLTVAAGIWFVPIVSGKVPAGVLFATAVTSAVVKHKCSLLKNLGFFTVVFSPGPLANTVDAETARRRTVFYHRKENTALRPNGIQARRSVLGQLCPSE